MKKSHSLWVALLLIVGLIVTACGGAAPAEEEAPAESEAAAEESEESEAMEESEEMDAGGIMVMEPFARASIPNGAAYMMLMNEGESDDTLVSAETDVAETVELHETTIDENEVMSMRPVEGGITIPAGGSATLEPGGLHVMLLGIQEELAVGDTFELTLNFEQAGSQTVTVEVAEGMTGGHGQMNHGEGEMEDGMEDEMEEMDDGEGEMEDGMEEEE